MPFKYSFGQRERKAWAKLPYSAVRFLPDKIKSSAAHTGTKLLISSDERLLLIAEAEATSLPRSRVSEAKSVFLFKVTGCISLFVSERARRYSIAKILFGLRMIRLSFLPQALRKPDKSCRFLN